MARRRTLIAEGSFTPTGAGSTTKLEANLTADLDVDGRKLDQSKITILVHPVDQAVDVDLLTKVGSQAAVLIDGYQGINAAADEMKVITINHVFSRTLTVRLTAGAVAPTTAVVEVVGWGD